MPVEPELYEEQLFGLLPPGRLWRELAASTLRRLLGACAAMLALVHAKGDATVADLFPATTVDHLPDWERVLGLPDPCTPAVGQTLQERRARVLERLTLQPRPTLLYLQTVAAAIGYAPTITEGPGAFQVTVGVPLGRVTYFRVGVSRVGDSLGKFDRAEDLECLLREVKPAHVELIFNYTGA